MQVPLGVLLKDECNHDDMVSILETHQEFCPQFLLNGQENNNQPLEDMEQENSHDITEVNYILRFDSVLIKLINLHTEFYCSCIE